MKNKLSILFIVLLFVTKPAISQHFMDLTVNADSIHSIIETLASDSLKGRLTGTIENAKAALFIAKKFQGIGLKKVQGLDGYFEKIDSIGNNVIGLLKGKTKPNELIIFSAHYDHIGTLKTNPYPLFRRDESAEENDSIFNGANDNASGISALITLAKYFSKENNNERSIMFIAFTGEELGVLGSNFSANQVDENAVIAMLNFDMIGRSYFKKNRPYITGAEHSNFITILNKNLQQFDSKKYGRNLIKIDPFEKEHLFFRSDNIAFARKGIPAHTIMATSPQDKFYHHLKDEIETIDCNLIVEIVKATIIGTSTIVNGTENPTRTKLPTQRR
jgi:hypothetical protein